MERRSLLEDLDCDREDDECELPELLDPERDDVSESESELELDELSEPELETDADRLRFFSLSFSFS